MPTCSSSLIYFFVYEISRFQKISSEGIQHAPFNSDALTLTVQNNSFLYKQHPKRESASSLRRILVIKLDTEIGPRCTIGRSQECLSMHNPRYKNPLQWNLSPTISMHIVNFPSHVIKKKIEQILRIRLHQSKKVWLFAFSRILTRLSISPRCRRLFSCSCSVEAYV